MSPRFLSWTESDEGQGGTVGWTSSYLRMVRVSGEERRGEEDPVRSGVG